VGAKNPEAGMEDHEFEAMCKLKELEDWKIYPPDDVLEDIEDVLGHYLDPKNLYEEWLGACHSEEPLETEEQQNKYLLEEAMRLLLLIYNASTGKNYYGSWFKNFDADGKRLDPKPFGVKEMEEMRALELLKLIEYAEYVEYKGYV